MLASVEKPVLAEETHVLALAEYIVVCDRNVVIFSSPLGACLGVTIFDPVARVGGMMHCLLPSSNIDPKRASARPAMFLDTGLHAMLGEAYRMRARPENLVISVAGGGRILDESTQFNIGQRNFDTLRGLMDSHGLLIRAKDIGGLTNRTMVLDAFTGEVRLKVSGQSVQKLLCKP
jgi:chemotaxis protein CheD